LGDAITAAAAVRAGGRPPQIGSFRAGVEERERSHREQVIAADAAARNLRNRIRIGQFEAKLKAKGKDSILDERSALIEEVKRRGFELSPDEESRFLLTGKLPAAGDEDDLLADAVQQSLVGTRGVTLPEQMDPFNISGQANKARIEREKEENKPDPNFAGFRSYAALENAIRQTADDIFNANKKQEEFTVHEEDPYLPGSTIEKKRLIATPTMTLEEATAKAIARFPGAEKFIPVPEIPPGEGITVDDVRKKLRERDAGNQ
jgi:hypothetical protein